MARNYAEDQNGELEALESIYYNELEVVEKEPRIKFNVKIQTEEFAETDDGLQCTLMFTFPVKYPDEAPEVEVCDENFDDHDGQLTERLESNIQELITENLGSEMVFSLVAGAQEFLNVSFDQIKVSREEAKLKKEREIEEAERKRFEGTRVTVETFMAWKFAFEKEMGIAERKAKELEANSRKLTGRELFMRDTSLVDSDITIISQAGDTIENVKIDESLFQAMDLGEDLPSDDDSDDDPDYKPE